MGGFLNPSSSGRIVTAAAGFGGGLVGGVVTAGTSSVLNNIFCSPDPASACG